MVQKSQTGCCERAKKKNNREPLMYTEGKEGIYYMFNQAVTEITPSFLVRDEGFG